MVVLQVWGAARNFFLHFSTLPRLSPHCLPHDRSFIFTSFCACKLLTVPIYHPSLWAPLARSGRLCCPLLMALACPENPQIWSGLLASDVAGSARAALSTVTSLLPRLMMMICPASDIEPPPP